jgi:hypothetical protein
MICNYVYKACLLMLLPNFDVAPLYIPLTSGKVKRSKKVKAAAEVIAGLPCSLALATVTLLCFVSDLYTASIILLHPVLMLHCFIFPSRPKT